MNYDTTTKLTNNEAYDLLNKVCTDKENVSVSFYDAVHWTVPADFDTSQLPKAFELWTIGDTEKTIRKIICSFSD